MKPSSATLRKASAALLDAAEGRAVDAREAKRLAEAIAPRRRVKKVLPFNGGRPLPSMTTSQIRQAVMERANGICEACLRPFTRADPFSMDHWLNGHGRRKQKESVETCWGIHQYSCHHYRQEYWVPAWASEAMALLGAVAFWNQVFRQHCDRQAPPFPFVPHIEHQPAQRRIP